MTDNNTLFEESNQLVNEILEIRDRLRVIEEGQIERGRCLPGTIYPGKRKLTMKDAQSIAKHAVARIDQIVNRFNEATDDSPKELRHSPHRKPKHDAE